MNHKMNISKLFQVVTLAGSFLILGPSVQAQEFDTELCSEHQDIISACCVDSSLPSDAGADSTISSSSSPYSTEFVVGIKNNEVKVEKEDDIIAGTVFDLGSTEVKADTDTDYEVGQIFNETNVAIEKDDNLVAGTNTFDNTYEIQEKDDNLVVGTNTFDTSTAIEKDDNLVAGTNTFDNTSVAVTKDDGIIYTADGITANSSEVVVIENDNKGGDKKEESEPYRLKIRTKLSLKDDTYISGITAPQSNPSCTDCEGTINFSFHDADQNKLFQRTINNDKCVVESEGSEFMMVACDYILGSDESIRGLKYIRLAGKDGISVQVKKVIVSLRNNTNSTSYSHVFSKNFCIYTDATGIQPGDRESGTGSDGMIENNVNGAFKWDCDIMNNSSYGNYAKTAWQEL